MLSGIAQKTLELLDKIPYPILIHINGIIVDVNNAALDIGRGFAKDNYIGRSILEFLEDESKSKAVAFMNSEQEYTNEHFGVIDPDRQHHIMEIKKSYFEEGDKRFTFLIMKDVTEYQKNLLMAARLQQSTIDTALPVGIDFSFDYDYMPHNLVSGDFFYFRANKKGHLLGILGDVRGKDVPAALTTSAMKFLFSEALTQDVGTRNIANYMNQGILTLLKDQYVAAIIFRIEPENDILSVTAAGISEFIHRDEEGQFAVELLKGPFLGMLEEDLFENKRYNFRIGDEVFFYSDGLPEVDEASFTLSLNDCKDFEGRCQLFHQRCDAKAASDDRTWIGIGRI